MLEWWNSMSITEQVFACIAIAATVILVIQSLLLLFGFGFGDSTDPGGADLDMPDWDVGDPGDLPDGDLSGDGFDSPNEIGPGEGTDGLSLFTVRGIVAFFAVGGWTGLVLLKYIHPALAVFLAFLAGTAALFGIALLFKYLLKLQDRGNLDIRNAVGKLGKVYIPIPPKGKGTGKIILTMQERLVELDAACTSDQTLPTGSLVRVCELLDEETVLVKPVEDNETQNNKGGISKWIQSQSFSS